uniref:Uncharacterized protein n=1 Tax=Romanomermis culicivorax TaxID=13658 RepID=A0A915HLB5_ROMCU
MHVDMNKHPREVSCTQFHCTIGSATPCQCLKIDLFLAFFKIGLISFDERIFILQWTKCVVWHNIFRTRCLMYLNLQKLKEGICCGLLIVRSNWLIYLNKGVKNQIIIENEQTINFPAITICNQMVAKRLIGCHWPSYNQFVRYYSLTSTIDGGEHWTSKLDKEVNK